MGKKPVKFDLEQFRVKPGSKVNLRKWRTEFRPDGLTKKTAGELLQADVRKLADLQDKLYAQDSYSLLLVFQAMDAAGKDGTVKHVMCGVNPQGVDVVSFKQPSVEELNHDFLWRCMRDAPERGRIGIFNRSHYEETLVVRVHPELLKRQHLPGTVLNGGPGKAFWRSRFDSINCAEKHLVANGTAVVKFFLHVSKDEQKRRFLKRIDDADRNWKFSQSDIEERRYWNQYMEAYGDMLEHTSTAEAPWYVVPADRKWATRLIVMRVILQTLEGLRLAYPKLDAARRSNLKKMRKLLEAEK